MTPLHRDLHPARDRTARPAPLHQLRGRAGDGGRGHGFTLFNQRPVHDLTYDGGRLVVIELEEDAGRLDIVLASTQSVSTLSRRAQVFAEQCRAVVGSSGEQADQTLAVK
jgi:hypothetical protein